ncbi:DsbA family protein [Actinomycetospora callitridis]|uniref:mycothiol-dependent nitroreductase Rv2466c family protein n=1 Tax=Actinomycetospora callitridis TaxID=913944 RepID=UPI002366D22F|nr:DsbA family protein [Actinomycetospora callitridis]MDD7916226.1 DsbA family protein [Actinomycetospora callitridis]
MSDRLEFFFDPICPFCWVTSRWVVEVARQRPTEVTWRPLSLAILNEEISYEERKKASPEYPDSHVRGLEMLRVVHAAREAHGAEVVGDLYTALGELVWDADPPEGDDFEAVMHEMARRRDLRPALERVGLPTDWPTPRTTPPATTTCAPRPRRRSTAAGAGSGRRSCRSAHRTAPPSSAP